MDFNYQRLLLFIQIVQTWWCSLLSREISSKRIEELINTLQLVDKMKRFNVIIFLTFQTDLCKEIFWESNSNENITFTACVYIQKNVPKIKR